MGGKPKGSASLNPWEALFSSATRPQAVTSSSYNVDEKKKKNDTSDVSSSSCNNIISTTTTNKGGYTILIQHSITPKFQRQYALSSTMAQNNTTTDKSSNNKASSTSLYTSLSSGMSTMNISKRSHQQQQQQNNSISSSGGYGISGPFLVKQSFIELCHKFNGAVIFVSTIGSNSSILDMMECMSTNSGICDDEMLVDSSYQAASGDNGNDGENTQHPIEKHRNAIQLFKRHGACVDLSSNPFGWDDDDDSDNIEGKDECDSFVHKCSMNKLQPIANAIRNAALSIESRRGSLLEEQSQRQTKQQQPIPIVFESMTPLLNVHGVDKVCVLLKSLGRVALSSTSNQSTKNNTILSPIVVPVLYESLQPSEHRSIEDVSDAFVHLNLAANGSVHQHESSSNDSNSTSVMSGVMDLVRRGGSGGLGGKLIRHCKPFHIMKSVSNSSSMIMTKDARDDCYWVLEHDEDEDNNQKKKGSSVTKSKKEISSSATDKEQDSSDTSTTAATPSRPRIYLQDDDPEYDDYDEEEDLDDDLDL